MSNKLSALIITFNEEKNIQDVFDSLNFVDEIIVLDSFSTDRTKEICLKNPNIKFFERVFDNFSAQRNHAISLSKNNWILFLDADERLTLDSKKEILLELENPKHKAYNFYRKYYLKKKPIHFCGTQNDKRIILFHKDFVSYNKEKLVHETIQTKESIGEFKSKIKHYTYNSYNEYKSKILHYNKLKAKEQLIKKINYNIFKQYFKTGFVFIQTYIIKLGFLDGINGLIICYLNAFSTFQNYEELKKLKEQAK